MTLTKQELIDQGAVEPSAEPTKQEKAELTEKLNALIEHESSKLSLRVENDSLTTRITALEAENAKLKGALKPFAEVAQHDISLSEHSDDIFRPMFEHNHAPILRIGHFRDAAATLSQIDKPKDTE